MESFTLTDVAPFKACDILAAIYGGKILYVCQGIHHMCGYYMQLADYLVTTMIFQAVAHDTMLKCTIPGGGNITFTTLQRFQDENFSRGKRFDKVIYIS